TPLPYLAIPVKKAIIRNRWKLKSRRDLKVLEHFQARAGEPAPTRNRLSTTTFLLYNAARLCTSKVPVLRVKRVYWDVGREQTVRLHAARDQPIPDPGSGKDCSRIGYADRCSVHSRFTSG
ncbi:MAG TPA: hypothetical protein VN456_16655, partial [Desulfosporosinus sp.]|nr:hypothetical protein [Desulfosporosinus sp.]